MQVIYLIYVELGWDNVVGIFTDTPENRKILDKYCKENDGLKFHDAIYLEATK